MTGIGEALAGLFKALALALGLVRDNRLREDGAREEREARHEADEAMRRRVDAVRPVAGVSDADNRLHAAGRLRD